jgi:hypothetical protein
VEVPGVRARPAPGLGGVHAAGAHGAPAGESQHAVKSRLGGNLALDWHSVLAACGASFGAG